MPMWQSQHKDIQNDELITFYNDYKDIRTPLLLIYNDDCDKRANITIHPIYKCPNGTSPQKETTRQQWRKWVKKLMSMSYKAQYKGYEYWICTKNGAYTMLLFLWWSRWMKKRSTRYWSTYKENCKKPCYAYDYDVVQVPTDRHQVPGTWLSDIVFSILLPRQLKESQCEELPRQT